MQGALWLFIFSRHCLVIARWKTRIEIEIIVEILRNLERIYANVIENIL